MQGRIFPILIGTVVVLGLLAWSSVFVVNEREQAIVLRFGEIARIEQQPGLYFKVPTNFVETVQIIDRRHIRFDMDDLRVQVRDGRFYDVDAFVVYRITNPRLFRENISGSIEVAEQRLRTRLDASLRRVYGQRGFESALSAERSAMMREVRDQMVADAENLGLSIIDVRIRRTDLTPQVSNETFARMSAERLAEAERIRARGRENAQRIRAIAQRTAVEITAEARRDGEILRGEGEAERNAIFADAFNRDPEFFSFYRSMQAYERALGSDSTTFVLSPDSDFFNYFGTGNGRGQQTVPTMAQPDVPTAAIDGTGQVTANRPAQ